MEARLKSMRNMLAKKVSRGEGDDMPVGRPEGGRVQFTTEDRIEEATNKRDSEGRSDSDSKNDPVVDNHSDSEYQPSEF
jgi:hypothetical protein